MGVLLGLWLYMGQAVLSQGWAPQGLPTLNPLCSHAAFVDGFSTAIHPRLPSGISVLRDVTVGLW